MRLNTFLGMWIVAAGAVAHLGASGNPVTLADAVKQGNREAIRSLLARRTGVNAREVDGTTALHWAVRAATGTVRLLIGAGADANAANR